MDSFGLDSIRKQFTASTGLIDRDKMVVGYLREPQSPEAALTKSKQTKERSRSGSFRDRVKNEKKNCFPRTRLIILIDPFVQPKNVA